MMIDGQVVKPRRACNSLSSVHSKHSISKKQGSRDDSSIVTCAAASEFSANTVPMLRNTKMPSGTDRLLWRGEKGSSKHTRGHITPPPGPHWKTCATRMGLSSIGTLHSRITSCRLRLTIDSPKPGNPLALINSPRDKHKQGNCIAVTYKTLSTNSVVFETRKPMGTLPATIHGPDSIIPCTLISTQLVYLHS